MTQDTDSASKHWLHGTKPGTAVCKKSVNAINEKTLLVFM